MLVCHVEQHKAMLRQEPQQEACGCQRYGTRKSFCAAEGGQGREHGIRCVPRERQIADAAFAAGSAYLKERRCQLSYLENTTATE